MSDQSSGLDPYAAVLADLLRRRDEFDKAIKVIESVRGVGSVAASTFAPEPQAQEDNPSGKFLGMSISEGAKALLRSRRKTMTSGEIAAGLLAGGLALNSSDPGNTIGSVLTRRFHGPGDIVRVSRGQWGLKEWYPNRNFKKKDDNGKDAPDGSDTQVTTPDNPGLSVDDLI